MAQDKNDGGTQVLDSSVNTACKFKNKHNNNNIFHNNGHILGTC